MSRILVVGAGDARDHAVYARLRAEGTEAEVALLGANALLARSPGVHRMSGLDDVRERVARGDVDTVVIQRPELLFAGAASLLARAGVRVVGPDLPSAELELSKVLAKDFMRRHGVMTPEAASFTSAEQAITFLRDAWSDGPAGHRYVVKSDRYLSDAALRTAVPRDLDEAAAAVRRLASAPEARGSAILVERRIEGRESSVHVLLDDGVFSVAPPVRDYKALFDGDAGPNTHGMGALAGGELSPEDEARLEERVLAPTRRGLVAEGRTYRGVLYVGVMWTDEGPVALEYNVRPGNPEWVALLPLLDVPLGDVLRGRTPPRWRKDLVVGCAFCTVPGYPLVRHDHKNRIRGFDAVPSDVEIFGEGVRGDDVLLAGEGRSLCVRAEGASSDDMRARLYRGLSTLAFPGMHYRTDIGARHEAR